MTSLLLECHPHHVCHPPRARLHSHAKFICHQHYFQPASFTHVSRADQSTNGLSTRVSYASDRPTNQVPAKLSLYPALLRWFVVCNSCSKAPQASLNNPARLVPPIFRVWRVLSLVMTELNSHTADLPCLRRLCLQC